MTEICLFRSYARWKASDCFSGLTPGPPATGLPSAGGNAPLWQLAHWPVTGNCVWFHFVGFQFQAAFSQLGVVAGLRDFG